ncbi:MAG: alpha-glucosidase [Myxococcales bacterium]|nr:alpha-glucosidase [Myxococcales bacterium]
MSLVNFQALRHSLALIILLLFFGCGGGTTTSDISETNDSQSDSTPTPDQQDSVDSSVEVVDAAPDTDSSLFQGHEACQDGANIPDFANIESGVVALQCPLYSLQLTPWTETMVRLRYVGEKPDPAPDRSYAVIQPSQEPSFSLIGTDTGIRICTEGLTIDVDTVCRLHIQDSDGVSLLEDPIQGHYQEGEYTLSSHTHQGVSSQTHFGAKVVRNLTDIDHVYGLGEKNGPLDKKGMILNFWNADVPGYGPTQDPLYLSVPFFVGLQGDTAFGVFTDNSYRMDIDLGATDPDLYTITVGGGEIDQYIIAGPDIAQVVERYTDLTGRMPLPPIWSLGYHQARYGYYPDSMVLDIANKLRAHSIPSDTIWLDIDYMDEYRCFTWSPEHFPDPAGLISDLDALGLKTIVIIDPGLKVDPEWPIYQEGLEQGLYLTNPDGTPFVGNVWPGDSVFPDFTNPATRAWWETLVPHLTDMGVAGIWNDMNEPANFQSQHFWTVPNWVQAHGDGTQMTMYEAHNLYGSTMAWASYEGLKTHRPDKRPFVLTRAGYAGVQRVSAVWTGDVPSTFEALTSTVSMLMGMGISGVPFVGSDVGGWGGGATPELYIRWIQVGLISPFFRNHSDKNSESQEPWAFGPQVEDVVRSAIEERYRLLPYLYSVFQQSSETGAPILRPLVYDFQTDPIVASVSNQAMLGPWLMAAPVLNPNVEAQQTVFPTGRWYDYYSGAIIDGPATRTKTVGLGGLPLYVREGAILPSRYVVQWSTQAPIQTLTLDLYPADEPSHFQLYEDDGVSPAYLDGEFAKTHYELQRTEEGAKLTIGAREGSYTGEPRQLVLQVRRVDSPATGVRVGETSLPQIPDLATWMDSDTGWFYEPETLSLRVRMADTADTVIHFEYPHVESEPAPPIEVRFRVQVPGDPDDTPPFIALSNQGWEHQPMTWVEDQVAEFVTTVPRGEWLQYKYTRGDWTRVEKSASCGELLNRSVVARGYSSTYDTVASWADVCNP